MALMDYNQPIITKYTSSRVDYMRQFTSDIQLFIGTDFLDCILLHNITSESKK